MKALVNIRLCCPFSHIMYMDRGIWGMKGGAVNWKMHVASRYKDKSMSFRVQRPGFEAQCCPEVAVTLDTSFNLLISLTF